MLRLRRFQGERILDKVHETDAEAVLQATFGEGIYDMAQGFLDELVKDGFAHQVVINGVPFYALTERDQSEVYSTLQGSQNSTLP